MTSNVEILEIENATTPVRTQPKKAKPLSTKLVVCITVQILTILGLIGVIIWMELRKKSIMPMKGPSTHGCILRPCSDGVDGTSIDFNGTPIGMNGTTVDMNGTSIDFNGTSIDFNGTLVDVNGTYVDLNIIPIDPKSKSDFETKYSVEILKEPDSILSKDMIHSIMFTTEIFDQEVNFYNDEKVPEIFKTIESMVPDVVMKKYVFNEDYTAGDDMTLHLSVKGTDLTLRRIVSPISDPITLLLEELDSPHLLKVYCTFRRINVFAGATESVIWHVVEGGYQTINPEQNSYSVRSLRNILAGLLSGMEYVHSKGYLIYAPRWINVVGTPTDKGVTSAKLADAGHLVKPTDMNEAIGLKGREFAFFKALVKKALGKMSFPGNPIRYKSFDGTESITTTAPLRVVDFYFVLSGFAEHPPTEVDVMLNHSYIRKETLKMASDRFGKRLYGVS